jgi:hypothetical protein
MHTRSDDSTTKPVCTKELSFVSSWLVTRAVFSCTLVQSVADMMIQFASCTDTSTLCRDVMTEVEGHKVSRKENA